MVSVPAEKGYVMGEESWIYRLLKRIGIIKEYDVDKTEMCKRAVDSGVCPGVCDRCAWGERNTDA